MVTSTINKFLYLYDVERFELPSHCHYIIFFHRSSADGDDDSDPCASYPYMQFESSGPPKVNLATAMCSRRHSLPVQTESFVRLFNTTLTQPNIDETSSVLPPSGPTSRHPSVPSASPMVVPQFIRQYSFGERRRSLKQPQLIGADSNYVTATMRAVAANRRRLFAGNRSPMISTVESLSSPGSSHSSSAAGGSVEKSDSSSFEQEVALTCAEESQDVIDQHPTKANNRRSVTNVTFDNAISTNNTSKYYVENTKTISKPACTNPNQHRSVTFQVSGSSESSENSKDDFQLDLEQCKKLVTNMQRNLTNKENINSSRRGSAPCNLLLNQINANKLALAAKAMSSNKDNNDKTQNESPVLPLNNAINDNDNVPNSYRRGSLPVDLNSFNNGSATLNNVTKNSILQTSAFENKNSTNNREDRIRYATKRRQMVHCKKILDKNHSVDIGAVSSSCRPPMLSRCSSLRSSSFGGVGGNVNYNNNTNLVPIEVSSVHLDNYTTTSFPINNSQSAKNGNDNLEAFSNMLMCRRGSAPVHRQSSFSHVPEKGCSLASSDDGGKTYSCKGNLNISFGTFTEKCCKDQVPNQQNNHNSTPSLSALLAREHIHVVKSRIQVLQNGSQGYYCNSNASTNLNSVKTNPQALLNEVVNNCINNGNSSLIDESMPTSNNSATIRRGSLPTDFHFYNDFGVC